MSVNIIRMPSAGLMFRPPLSKVMPLPTSTTCCGLAAPRVRLALYRTSISRGGLAEPAPTATHAAEALLAQPVVVVHGHGAAGRSQLLLGKLTEPSRVEDVGRGVAQIAGPAGGVGGLVTGGQPGPVEVAGQVDGVQAVIGLGQAEGIPAQHQALGQRPALLRPRSIDGHAEPQAVIALGDRASDGHAGDPQLCWGRLAETRDQHGGRYGPGQRQQMYLARGRFRLELGHVGRRRLSGTRPAAPRWAHRRAGAPAGQAEHGDIGTAPSFGNLQQDHGTLL